MTPQVQKEIKYFASEFLDFVEWGVNSLKFPLDENLKDIIHNLAVSIREDYPDDCSEIEEIEQAIIDQLFIEQRLK